MPDIVFDTLDKVPEGLKEHAKEVDGKVVVKVVPQSKLEEFRDNNVAISKERDAVKGRLAKFAPLIGEDGDDEKFVTEVGELRGIAQKVKDGSLKASGDVEAEVARRVASMKTGFETQLQEKATETAAWKTKAVEADSRFRRSIIDQAVTDAAMNAESGVDVRALEDIRGRAHRVFQVDDNGKLVAKDGEAVIYGTDGVTPMTPKEWIGKLRDEAPYFFKNSSGGGAAGSQGGNSIGGMSKADFDKLPAEQRIALARKHGMIGKR